MKRQLFGWLLASILLVPIGTSGQESNDVRRVFIDAQPVEALPGQQPISIEGWAILSFIVTVDGGVESTIVERSSSPEFEQAALAELSRKRFEPATVNGISVRQSFTGYKMSRGLGEVRRGVTRPFEKSFFEIQSLITDGRLADADAMLSDLEYERRDRPGEDALFHWLVFQHSVAVGSTDFTAMRAALDRALVYEGIYLPPDAVVVASQALFSLHAQAFDFSSAISVYQRLRNDGLAMQTEQYDRTLESMSAGYQAILDLVASNQPLSLNGRIGENDHWIHGLLRRRFYLDDIEGTVDMIDIRCRRGTAQFQFAVDDIWAIPDSWGVCGLYVSGVEGTKFTLYELPAE
jgi:TonB family protein